MNEPVISVGILTESAINFELYGEFNSSAYPRKLSGKFSAFIRDKKIVLTKEGNELLTKEEIVITPADFETESFLLRDVKIGKNFHWEKYEDQRFRGSLKLIIEDDKITAVNIIPLEEYLLSVISSEMSASSSLELLKAHAVVSRSWLIAQLNNKKQKKDSKISSEFIINEKEIIKWYDREEHLLYDFCSDDHCQRYQGVLRLVNDAAFAAIEETRGMVLTYNGEVCDTRFSKCCGGITESFENVWAPVKYPYLSSIIDYKFEPDGYFVDLTKEDFAVKWIKGSPHAFCNTTDQKILSQVLVDYDQTTRDFYRWKVEYTQDEISEIIFKKSGIDFGSIKDLLPAERGYSGRITKLRILGTKSEILVGKELEIRKWLSKSHLYSSAFIVHKEKIKNGIPERFILEGAGWGHGVGLCQIGAAVMGEMGYSFDEILSHYFKGTRLEKAY
ncbi:SpoIID/LytB domain-containing protein [Melioribacteraceae bacterium 4301-Me]|uniref:SpoIID/LytB domain-containing protein n=1 Tax=Pyranulibacter aquaticus TaxID=3163344 RepID=UPI003597AFC1